MNRSELIDAVASKAEVTKAEADKVVKALVEVVEDAVTRQDKVTIPGFLSIEATHRSARTARNPRTGEEIAVPATWTAKVSAGSALKAAAAKSN